MSLAGDVPTPAEPFEGTPAPVRGLPPRRPVGCTASYPLVMVVCDDGSVWMWETAGEPGEGYWREAFPIPGTPRESELPASLPQVDVVSLTVAQEPAP